VDGETAKALHRRLLVVLVAVALVLLPTVRPTGGHAGPVGKDCTDSMSAQDLKKLLPLAGRDPWVFEGPLADRDAEGHHGVAQVGHQGPRGEGAADAVGGEGPAVDDPAAAVTPEKVGCADPLPR